MIYEVEFYCEDGQYCAYIGANGASGYEIIANTASERARQIGEFFESVEE